MKTTEKQPIILQPLQMNKHLYRDKVNATYDRLYALSHYTYIIETKTTLIEDTRPKPFVRKRIKSLSENVKLNKPKTTMLTYDYLIEKLAYDPTTGEITHNDGLRAEESAICKAPTPKKLRKQNLELNRLPLRAKNKPPVHNGWLTYTTDQYALLDDDIRPLCTKRYYLERNPDKSSLNATIRKAYYIRPLQASPRIHINNTTYKPQAIAYLYMQAGGRFDYTGGLDNITRIQEETLCEPYGMQNINPRTNKRIPYPCRDGNPLNYAWDNIKPDAVSPATLTYTPKPRKPAPQKEKKVHRRTVCVERNIRIETDANNTTTYTVHNMGTGNKTTVCHSWEDAVTVYNAQLKRIKGHKQTLRNGTTMITSMR